MDLPQPPQEATDIFSLSDEVLAGKLQFIEEIGFGNWGSVWLCRPKSSGKSSSDDKHQHVKVAVKVVHRNKTPTTAARVRSLWNEMKVVRSFKYDPHPSIIPFHSFIITPSYALITMAYLPTLIPVEVEETDAREWFRSLLSAIEFLHKRGVVHNDIKPANILLSEQRVPVLVDFGFAEIYQLSSDSAFHSNLAYGTPEYLSPERARGLLHDTRKSDVWSLGIAFFEILIGRTPFEYQEGEQFSSKADLEKYWSRTMKGKWVGSWKMSKGLERMLRRMISPNADLRCTASDAVDDPYWQTSDSSLSQHRRSASAAHSPTACIPPKEGMGTARFVINKETLIRPIPGLSRNVTKDSEVLPSLGHSRSKSQPKALLPKVTHVKKRAPVPAVLANLSPIKGSPTPVTPNLQPLSALNKENQGVKTQSPNVTRGGRKPLGALTSQTTENCKIVIGKPKDKVDKRKSGILADSTTRPRNIQNASKDEANTSKGSVRDRMKEWERERERLRELQKLEEREKDEESDIEQEVEVEVEKKRKRGDLRVHIPQGETQKSSISPTYSLVASEVILSTPSSSEANNFAYDHSPITPNQSTIEGLKHGWKVSLDKTVRLYKSSTLAQVAGRITPVLSSSFARDEVESKETTSERESWETESVIRDADSSLPVCRHAVRNERVAAESRADRMTIWMRNVEKVVEDARETFAASTPSVPLPPLPLAPVSRSTSMNQTNRTSRLPRKVLAANEIFLEDNRQGCSDQSSSSIFVTAKDSTAIRKDTGHLDISSEEPSRISNVPRTPQTSQRARRATVTTRSPEPSKDVDIDPFGIDPGSPSKRKEKSRSQGNLFQHISPISKLELELQQQSLPAPSPRLSSVLDRSLFIAPPVVRENSIPSIAVSRASSTNYDDLTSSPCHVDPYPPRKSQDTPSPIDSPAQRRIEGVYDRFLMATSGVKRHGRGYQSDNAGPVYNIPEKSASLHQRSMLNFQTRRPMPPPVSSDDQRKAVSVDELGIMVPNSFSSDGKDAGNNTISFVRRTIKAIVAGKTVSRRLSRTVVA